LSKDDPAIELHALDLKPDDRLLCIASAGELPLSILAKGPLLIDAVDISLAQLQLSKLKLAAVLALDIEEAARFLGYISCDKEQRLRQFGMVREYLSESERNFWEDHLFVFTKGPIHYGRYEQYFARFRRLALFLLGGHEKLYGLFECESREAQEEYFDKFLESGLLEKLFKIMFHPTLYKRRGISEQGLIHEGQGDIARVFFKQFRNFCTQTLARENYLLQFLFLGNVIYYEALPGFLQESSMIVIRLRHNNIHYHHLSYSDVIRVSPEGTYNKFALSNVGDWLDKNAFSDLLQLIAEKADSNSKALLRYVYNVHPIPEELDQTIIANPSQGEELRRKDHFPFYNLMPMDIKVRKEVFDEH
jgi:S-adenosylmethionine:diacylglycerol 3-amino-3-carboxypropyl transferase